MPELSRYHVILSPLNSTGLKYCITGSVASIAYGEPRYTHDIDIVVLIERRDIPKIEAAFPLKDYYCPPPEILEHEIGRGVRGMFNVVHHQTQFKADFFIAARDPLHHWALDHRRETDLDDQQIWLAPPEYVILRKLEAFREGDQDKHIRDVRFMLAVTEIDPRFMEVNIERLGLREQWLVCQPEVQ